LEQSKLFKIDFLAISRYVQPTEVALVSLMWLLQMLKWSNPFQPFPLPR